MNIKHDFIRALVKIELADYSDTIGVLVEQLDEILKEITARDKRVSTSIGPVQAVPYIDVQITVGRG